MRIHCVQHVPFEGPAAIKDWALERGHVLSQTALYKKEPLPPADEFDWLVVMGGPMGAYDEDVYPWLAAEKRFIGRAIAEGRAVLGICLGAQLMAAALGGTVRANAHARSAGSRAPASRGRGRRRLRPAPARVRRIPLARRHLQHPAGRRPNGESDACPAQAFAYNDKVIGLQFHLESTPESAEALVRNCENEIVEGAYIQDGARLWRIRSASLGSTPSCACSWRGWRRPPFPDTAAARLTGSARTC
jgi:GMP synthase-like glutamine amidotransferase